MPLMKVTNKKMNMKNQIETKEITYNFRQKLQELKNKKELNNILPIPKTSNLINGVKGYQKKDVNAMDKNKEMKLNIPNYELNIIKDLYGDLWNELGSSFCIRLLFKIAVDTINENK